MGEKTKWPVTLKVDIESEGLKRVVEEGRLMDFVGAFSTLAAEQLKNQIVEQLAEAGVGLAEAGKGISIALGFDVDDPYGTGPKPWPKRSWIAIDAVPLPDMPIIELMRRVVREELARAGKL